MKKTATLVKKLAMKTGADQALYRCDPPMSAEDGPTEFVVVSAVVVPYSGPETYIFPADKDGEITDWLELDGSFRGGLDHAKALADAGYEIAE